MQLTSMLTGETEPAVPSWFSIISPAGTRDQVVRQARRDEYLATRPGDLAERLTTAPWRALTTAVREWPELDQVRRVVLIGLLTQLGCHRLVADLVPRVKVTPDCAVGQQLAYEVARSDRQLDRRSTVPLRVFTWLADHASRPSLRVSAGLQMASALVRAHQDPPGASTWLARCRQACGGLRAEPAWLEHLVRSRVHRAAALVAVRQGAPGDGAAEMRAALAEDDRLSAVAAGELQLGYQRENRAVVLEAFLKLDTLAGTAAAPADVVAQAKRVDPFDVDLLFAAGRFLTAREAWDEATGTFLAAAASGTVRGAVAAFEAGACFERLGRPAEAAAASRWVCRPNRGCRT